MRLVNQFTGDEIVTLADALAVLNRLNQADPIFLGQLIEMRVSCQPRVAMDPFTQCGQVGNGQWQIGLLGILNALFGIDSAGMGGIVVTRDRGTGRVASFGLPPAPQPVPVVDPNHDPTAGAESAVPEPALGAEHPVTPAPTGPEHSPVPPEQTPEAPTQVSTGNGCPVVVDGPPVQATAAAVTGESDGDGCPVSQAVPPRSRRPVTPPPGVVTSRTATEADDERLRGKSG